MKAYKLIFYNNDPGCDPSDYRSSRTLGIFITEKLAIKAMKLESNRVVLDEDYCQEFSLQVHEVQIIDVIEDYQKETER